MAALDGFDLADIDHLEAFANALLSIVEAFDAAPRSPKAVVVPPALESECRVRRRRVAAMLAGRVAELPDVAATLLHLKLSYGPVDLALDLRALAAHLEKYADDLVDIPGFDPSLAPSSRALAKRLEDVLYSADTPQLREVRDALHRVWTQFERAYRDTARLGREIFHHDADEIFPSLESIAYVARTARHASSTQRPATIIVEETVPSTRSRSNKQRRASSQRFHSLRAADEAPSLSLDVTLHASSESNLYLGFTQDVAEGGIFVATYETRPLGAVARLAVRIDDGEPIGLTGFVHWARPHGSADDDLPVGLGVRLTDVSADAGKALQSFAARRTPIFYDE